MSVLSRGPRLAPALCVAAICSALATSAAHTPAAARSVRPEPVTQEMPAAGSAETGTVRGALNSPFARRYAAVVYIEAIDGVTFEAPTSPSVMDQRELRFVPHVLPVLVGSTIEFPNSDAVRHNVYTTKSSACTFNLGTYPAGATREVRCDTPGVIVLLCNVHVEMSGYIVVAPTPYFAVTDELGQYSITGIPAGDYQLTFWHQRLASVQVPVSVSVGHESVIDFSGLKRK